MSAPLSSTPSDEQLTPNPVRSGDGASSLPDPETKRAKTEGMWEKFVKPGLDVVTLVVSLTGLVSIWIAIHEMKTNEEVSWVTTYHTIESLSLEIDKLLVDHPAMVPYFVSNKPIDSNNSDFNLELTVADARIGASTQF